MVLGLSDGLTDWIKLNTHNLTILFGYVMPGPQEDKICTQIEVSMNEQLKEAMSEVDRINLEGIVSVELNYIESKNSYECHVYTADGKDTLVIGYSDSPKKALAMTMQDALKKLGNKK